MKRVYPVILSNIDDGYMVYIPDFDINTQGDDLVDAIEMARDAIGIIGIDMEDDKKEIPEPSLISKIEKQPEEIISLVDIDFAEYRRRNDNRTVRRNVSLPAWLNAAAESANLNVSAVLQAALKEKLNLYGR